jgi:membrane protease YdiL (CAAX protease family)
MPAPALAHLLTRWITREGWHDLWLRPHLKAGWPAWLIAWFLPGVLVISGAALFFLIFPQYFDPAFGPVQALLDKAAALGRTLPFGKTAIIVLQTFQAFALAPILNALPTLGEEFGWRAYLQPKLLPLGWRRALILTGAIWGVWHWPILAMGYNYGLKYAGAPWLGMVEFVGFTILFGIILGWLTLRGQSVWPAVIGHGALNGIAALPALFLTGEPNPLIGPLVFGLVALLPTLLVAAWLLLHPPLHR